MRLPVKTFAIFVHLNEFDFTKEEIPPLIKTVSENCFTREDVEQMSDAGLLPRIFRGIQRTE